MWVLFCLLAVLGAGAEPPPRAAEDPWLTYRPGRYGEFVIGPDGTVVLFPNQHNAPAFEWRNGAWTESRTVHPEGRIRDVVAGEGNTWLVLEEISPDESWLSEFSGARLLRKTRFTGRVECPTLHRAADGSIWMTSREGRAYGWRNGKTETHEFGPEVDKKSGCYSYYPTTLSIEIPGRGLWFWSHVEHEALNFSSAKLAIEGFHAYQDGQWRTIPFPAGKLGGVAMLPGGDIIVGSRYKGAFSLSAKDNSATDLRWRLPPEENSLFLHAMPSGQVLGISARPSMFMRLPPVKDGWVGTLFAADGDKVRILLDDVDFKRTWRDKGRPVVDVEEGTFIAEAQTGLIFVSRDLKDVRRLDWRCGIPFPNVDRMRVRGDRLYLLDRERGFAVVDYRRWLRSTPCPGSEDWEVTAAAGDPLRMSDGSVWYLTASTSAALRECAGTSVTEHSLKGSEFPVESLWYLAGDTRNRLWLISNHETSRTAFLQNGEWRTFELRETAYSTVAQEEKRHPDFRIGDPSQHCYPVFAGDGRVAYQNEWSRLCAFDGQTWDYGYSEGKIDNRSPDGPPFYDNGVLTVKAGDSMYQWVSGSWRPADRFIRSPYAGNPRQQHAMELPRDFPGDGERCSIRVRDSEDLLWAGTQDELYRGTADVWAPFLTRGTPLIMATSITRLIQDRTGALWFGLSGGDYTRIARFRPRAERLRLEWAESPPAKIASAQLALRVRASGSSQRYVFQYRRDRDPWQNLVSDTATAVLPIRSLQNGRHTIEVRALDDLLRSSQVLDWNLEVARDYDREVGASLPQLSSADLRQREAAARALVDIGAPALPMLEAREAMASSDEVWWLKAVQAEIIRGTTRE